MPRGALLIDEAENVSFAIDQVMRRDLRLEVDLNLLIDVIRMIRMLRAVAGEMQDDRIDGRSRRPRTRMRRRHETIDDLRLSRRRGAGADEGHRQNEEHCLH